MENSEKSNKIQNKNNLKKQRRNQIMEETQNIILIKQKKKRIIKMRKKSQRNRHILEDILKNDLREMTIIKIKKRRK